MLSRGHKTKYKYFKVRNTDLFNHSDWVSCNVFCQHRETCLAIKMPYHKRLGSHVQFLYMCRCREDSSKGSAHLWISWAAHALLPHTWIKDSFWFWNEHTYCTYLTQCKFTQKSLGFLSWLSKMMSEMSSAINNWTVDSWLPFSSQSNLRRYMLWSNLNCFLNTIFLQEKAPALMARDIAIAAVEQWKSLFLFVMSIKFTSLSQKPYLVKSLC